MTQEEKNQILAIIRGCNTGNSVYTIDNKPLKNFDKNKLIGILKLMKQKEIDLIFSRISDLEHHEASTLGLLATDKSTEQLRDYILRNVKFNTPEEGNTCYTEVEEKLNEIMFEIK